MTNAADVTGNRTLVRVQAISGLLFALFLLVHLVNQMLATLGPATYDGAQRVLRRGYQAPGIEIVLVIAPLFVHAAAGVLRMLRRRGQGRQAPSNIYARLHRDSAIVLLIFFIGHVTATRGASLIYGIYPEFAGVAFTLRWVPAYFWPYYTIFGLAGLYHMIYGIGVALPVLGLRGGSALRRPMFIVPLATVFGIWIFLGLLGQGGVLRTIGDPMHRAYAKLVLRLAGSAR